MWSFKIGHSTLQVMQVMLMVQMVCSAPVHREPPPACTQILDKIKAAADSLLKKEWKNIEVLKPIINLRRCPNNFFCLAEKVIENARGKNVEKNKLSTLSTNLKRYNTQCPTNCTLQTADTYHLKTFLNEVKECVNHFHNKPQMNNKDS